MVKTTDIDRLIASSPINRATARVVSGGVHWEPDKASLRHEVWQDMPLKTLPYSRYAAPGDQLQAGQRFGRLTVVGYGGKGSAGAKYVCRCDCGKYGYRRAASLRQPKTLPCCEYCDYLEELKSGQHRSK